MELLIKIAELLVKLLESKKQRQDRYYQEVVSKLYELSKKTYDEYMAIFRDAEENIKAGKPLTKIIADVELQRLGSKSERDHMRSILESIDPVSVDDYSFEGAVFGLLRGRMSHAIKNFRTMLEGIPRYISNTPLSNDEIRDMRLLTVKEAIEYTEFSWKNINDAYQVYLRNYLDR